MGVESGDDFLVVKITGQKAFSAKLRRLHDRGKDGEIGSALFAGGERIADYAKGSIMAGAVSGKYHVPSKPGEPPSNNTQHLHDNIETVQVKTLIVEVSSNASYSAYLENGSSKMQPRPFMGPAVRAKRDEVVELIGKAIDHVLAGGSIR